MTSAESSSNEEMPKDGIGGFSQRVLRYFLTFLQTDFKRQQAPRRKIQLKTETGFRTGVPLRKYPTLYNAMWKFASTAPASGLQFRLPPSKYTAPINPVLRDLIRQHIAAITADVAEHIVSENLEYAKGRRATALENPERFVDGIQLHFVELVGQKLVVPLLTILESSFREQAYSAIESVYDVESDLTDAVTARVVESLPAAINTLIINGDIAPIQAVFSEFFEIDGIRTRIQSFFDDFATADAFLEVRDLQHTLRSAEQQSFYLYLCEIRFGSHAFPLFYIPASFEFDDEKREYLFEFDPHLFINKQAIDWILQERRGEATALPISPVQDRIIYLDGERTFVDEMEMVINRLVPSLDLAASLDLRRHGLQQQSSTTLKIANTAYFSIFDKSDEALLNDYEELLAAFDQEQSGARSMFEKIVRGFITDNPVSVRDAVDGAWDSLPISEKLVAVSPIPVNEEQRKILAALKDPLCSYISVQGPPGTGKSHTITAIAFDCILNGQNVLVLSDKTEALDVVQDKLESVLQRVRPGDDEFPNPILRLGKTGSTYNRLISASAREKIKTHHDAAKSHQKRIDEEATSGRVSLKADIDKTIRVFSEVKLSEMDALHRLEAALEKALPGITKPLQNPSLPTVVESLYTLATKLSVDGLPVGLVARLQTEQAAGTLPVVLQRLEACRAANTLIGFQVPALSVFSVLEPQHHPVLMQFLIEYEALRMPVFGYLFRGGQVQSLNMRVGTTLPCPNPVDLHKRLPHIKVALGALGSIRDAVSERKIVDQGGFVYRLLRNGEAGLDGVDDLTDMVDVFLTGVLGKQSGFTLQYGDERFATLDDLLRFVVTACQYARAWHKVSSNLKSVPTTDYVGAKSRLEQLHTARMTREIDRRFLDFVTNKTATAKAIGGVIKAKQKFPEEEFHYLSDAFPCIISGIRDYAEYVPLKQQLFDVVVIDEGSQVSVAQALPALLRAKKVIVFGDQKQFSNVKSAQASNAINAGHLTDIEAYFRANVSNAATKLQRLKHFDVKRSILEFFDLIANYQSMLRKHFRGYSELISFSSKTFYDGQLQAIKIRSLPIDEVIRFEIVANSVTVKGKNTNQGEADFILQKLKQMVDGNEGLSVGIITPFREQLKLLNDVIYRDAYAERFDTELRLKVMTFDTCQGEERDLIVFSMVATDAHDALNYIFPVTLDGVADKVEDALKVQRLNVGFSRAKEGMLFVLSKPVENFKGSIGRVLMHYKTILEARPLPSAEDTDPASPMEKKVLDWIGKTAFYHRHVDRIEVMAQFPIGEYLKQLDPFYEHPAYRCDFLLRLHDPNKTLNVVIEYDGFMEHFTDHAKIHNGNWDHYYRPEDIERQMVIESYGYRFLRINRFNLGDDPIDTLSARLYDLAKTASVEGLDATVVLNLKDDVDALTSGAKKRCSKCEEIRDLTEFWDVKLKSGNGGYGRICTLCKTPAPLNKPTVSSAGRKRYGRQRW